MPRRHKPASPFRHFNSSPEVIRPVVMMYVRFPLSLRRENYHRRPVFIPHGDGRTANADKPEVDRWANNGIENSHLSFRRPERTMLRFRRIKSLQKFPSVHANVHNHFDL